MILSASLEFEKKYNSEIVERSSDEHEMPQVMLNHYVLQFILKIIQNIILLLKDFIKCLFLKKIYKCFQ